MPKKTNTFNDMRVTAMEVSTPLLRLANERMALIKSIISQVAMLPESPERDKILNEYNIFVQREAKRLSEAQGK